MIKRVLCGVVMLAIFAGCGPVGPVTHKVTGTVTLDAKPVENALVTFVPDDSENGKFAVGQTNAEGYYTLTTTQSGDGAVAGSYKIQVMKYPVEDGGPSSSGQPASGLSQEEQDAANEKAYAEREAEREREMAAGAKSRPQRNELPAKYAGIGTSNLSATITADGENVVDLELVSR